MEGLLSFKNEVFASFVFCSAVVLIKTLFMSLLTAYHRMTKKVFANEEDAASVPVAAGSDKLKPIFNNASVERVRRNHLNDIENVFPFVLLGSLYVMTDPTPWIAIFHFRVFMVSRLLHTICYQIPIPQPSRGLCFMAGVFVCFSMAIQVLHTARHAAD